jgi:hypothetical protein
MKPLAAVAFCCLAAAANAFDIDESLDRFDDSLRITAFDDNLRARLSGTLDVEGYHFSGKPTGLIDTTDPNLFNARLSLFLDTQIGPHVYAFVQARLDRGFDPTEQAAQVRLDEYAFRVTPWHDGRVTFQIGKFATVAGNWMERHLSWDNPFINAPLPYENVTAVSDLEIPIYRYYFGQPNLAAKYEYLPLIWGPSYASGASISGRLGMFEYAAEVKNASLSSRPETWDLTSRGFEHPTFTGHVAFEPNEMWRFGFSGSEGAYVDASAEPLLPPDRDIGDYDQIVFGQDISFAWHHLQIWAEVYEVRFEVPRVGDADTLSYYLEAKYKFTPQLFGALRWNQQFYGSVPDGYGSTVRWGEDLTRVDAAVAYRFTRHTQLKLQYTLSHTNDADDHMIAGQFTVRF